MIDSPLETPHVLKNGRPTIAVLVGSMTSHYHEGIMRGAAYIARQKNYNVIGFCGGVINSSDHLTLARDKVFKLINMNLIAGVISPFSSHMRFVTGEESEAFVAQYNSVPVVNIGSHISGYTNVVADYEVAFTELFDHLYHTHGYRNIMLVRGPEHHASSVSRAKVYKKLLEQYQLPYDDDLVLKCDLKRRTAKAAVEHYFDHVNKPVDAVIAISDNQALGVIDACKERGLRVPEDIGVIGSMDSLEGAFSSPSLSSIKEPLFELGQAAAIEVINQIEGKPATVEIKIPTSLITRDSCGCNALETRKRLHQESSACSTAVVNGHDPIFKETQDFFEKTIEQHKGGIIRDDVNVILRLFQESIYKGEFSSLLTELRNKLEHSLRSEDVVLWLSLIAQLELSALRYLKAAGNSITLVDFIAELTTIKNEAEQITFKFQSFETEYYLNYFRAIVNNLNASFDLTTIKKYTVDILQLSELYIHIFHDPNAEKLTAKNIVSVRNNQFIEIENKDFCAQELIPQGVEPYQGLYTLMVFPLSFGNKPLGFMTTNLSGRKGTAFENLRAIISSALKNEMLIQDLKRAEERFSDIAHSTSNWLWETDAQHRFTYCSHSSNDVIGYAPDFLMGKDIHELNVESGDSYIQMMHNHEALVEIECWYQHQNGRIICLLISAKPIIHKGVFSGYRGIFEDVTEQRLQEEKIKSLAYSDILTGLPNRTLLHEKLQETIRISSKYDQQFALMFIDLDHFKNINDSMGHAAGDQLLVELTERLNNSIRRSDTLARLGGDEFVIILADIDNEAEVIDVAHRIFKNLQPAIVVQNKSIYSTLSLGISIYPNDGLEAETLLKKGDSAMYQAKSQGRNGYVFYDTELEKKNTLRNTYEEVLREALTTDGFVLHYQPQVDIETNQIVGLETLVRIDNAQMGIVAPNLFIPLAEELGLIGQVDEWVFEHTCAQYAKWREQGYVLPRLSINLSAMQLRNDAVLIRYTDILQKYQVEPRHIQLEITENALIGNEKVALGILQGFKDYGISIALDDFGTGFSSLSCINLYPIDTIKIDRSFVKDAVYNKRNEAIIKGTVLIGQNLQLKIIAEGVESHEQYTFIKQMGCDEIQGFYFHRPGPIEVIEPLLTKQSVYQES
ncbi:EAL domain-containing protein [Vibrio hippocampi]|uniref:HTH-type transcriptional repressor PurR n=1 Tax=Vibrio hippocampi TaxID=654686 RepID=A0ABM8ZGB2_9VIBR|nr:EAL domain-containing protein [Vibrio hippocampi]CAH0525671.1 HTH-type transcriptional repressor PurR [Vibrio hippocampi]